MVHTRSSRRLTFLLALGLVAGGGLATADTALAQGGRFRVLVPRLEAQGGAQPKFGEQIAEEMKKLIDSTPTHMPVEKGDLKSALKKYNIKEDALNCITSQQLATLMGVELVMCGQFEAAASGTQVAASFISPKDRQTFEVAAFTATNPKEAAKHIFDSFQNYVNQLRLTAFCMEDLGSENWQGALEKCEQSLAINARSETANYGKGYALMKLEQFEPALASLKTVLELNPINQDALLAAGFVSAKLERPEDSRNYYRQYLELNPGNTQVRLTVATEAASAGDPAGALQIAEEGLQAAADDVTLMEYAGYFAAAAAAKMVDPSQGQNAGRERSPEQVAMYEKALGYFTKVVEAKGAEVNTAVLENQINALTQLGRAAEAAEAGAKAVATKPAEAKLWNVYAAALKEAGKVVEAVAALDTVLVRDPQFQNVAARQALWLLEANQFDRSKAAFRKAIEKGELEADNAARAIFAAGYNSRFTKGQQMEALPFFESAREFASTAQTRGMINYFHAYALFNRAIKVQEPSTAASAREALPLFQKALELFQQSTAYAESQPGLKLPELMANTRQYIEIQEALVKRGR